MSDSENDYGESNVGQIIKNHIYLRGEIDRDSIDDLITNIDEVTYDIIKIKFKYDIDSIKIYLHIDSEGGGVHQSFRAIDKIKRNKIPIVTIADGYIASAATLIFLSGSERWCTRHSYFLIHQLRSLHHGKICDLKDELKNCVRIENRIKQFYLNHTRIPKAKLEQQLKRELEFDANAALGLGMIDKII